ncbi:MAG: hypothetical protein ACHP7O_11200, partial [Burkholderiales bacterium]
FVAHQFNVYRDRKNKRRDMIVQYLLEAYRRLESAAHREKTEEQAIAFESAVADIQLLGTFMQISAMVKCANALASSGGTGTTIDEVLRVLRNNLRKELGLSALESTPVIFRFERHLDSGNWKGEVVPRTDPVVIARDK